MFKKDLETMNSYRVTKLSKFSAIIKCYENYSNRSKRRIIWTMKFYITKEDKEILENASGWDVYDFVARNEGVRVPNYR